MTTQIEPSKIQKAKKIWRDVLSIEARMRRDADSIKENAYVFGRILSEFKEIIGHGKWTIWLCATFSELGDTDEARMRRAQRCMDFYRRHALKTSNSTDLDDSVPDVWDAEAERKLMYGYVPAKQRKQLSGDEKDAPTVHHLTWVNNFYKWERQIAIGLASFPHISVLQHELEEPFRRIIEICGREWAMKILELELNTISVTSTRTFDSNSLTNGELVQ